jgi:hypothetical protein
MLVTLDRPSRGNAFSLAMAESLLKLPSVLPDTCRVLIFTGGGPKAFCTGRDLAESKTHTQEQADRYLTALVDGVLGVRELPFATSIHEARTGTSSVTRSVLWSSPRVGSRRHQRFRVPSAAPDPPICQPDPFAD